MRTWGPRLALVTLCGAVTGSAAEAQTADAVATAFFRSYASAAEQRDVATLRGFHDAEAFVLSETGPQLRPVPPAGLETTLWAWVASMRSLNLRILPERSAFLKPDVILSQGSWEASGRADNDLPLPPMKGRWVAWK